MSTPTLRPYQGAALDAICDQLEQWKNRLLVQMATSLGKTHTFASLPTWPRIAKWLKQFPAGERKMLVIAHRQELLDQAADKICIGESVVLKAQTIMKGRNPRTKKTAMNIPHVKNQRLALAPIVFNTSALMMALSTDETASKSESPMIVKRAENIIFLIY